MTEKFCIAKVIYFNKNPLEIEFNVDPILGIFSLPVTNS